MDVRSRHSAVICRTFVIVPSPSVRPLKNLRDRLDHFVFNAIYSRTMVYDACWEDPANDRKVLGVTGEDNLLVITSAGCNVLDYAMLGPKPIYTPDANPQQGVQAQSGRTAGRDRGCGQRL